VSITGEHPLLDHLVYAVPDLTAGVADVATRTGIIPVRGGRHPGGTANYLLALGPTSYLEIIGPDREAASGARPRVFGLDRLTEARLAAWAVHPEDLDRTAASARAHGYDPGEVSPLSRRTPEGTLLSWRLTRREQQSAVELVPFLIDWGATEHPSRSGLPQVRLLTLAATHPDPPAVLHDLDAVGVDLDVTVGPQAALSALLDTPNGPVTLR
jgi:hypothetical protein